MNIKNIYISDLDFSSFHQNVSNFAFKNIFILFPDPWHKRRHFKRKLINQSFIKKIKLICDNNTSVVIATDNMIYQDIIRESFKKDKHFEKLVEKTNNRFLGIVDVVETKYYKKALKNNNESIFFVFNKKQVLINIIKLFKFQQSIGMYIHKFKNQGEKLQNFDVKDSRSIEIVEISKNIAKEKGIYPEEGKEDMEYAIEKAGRKK